MKNKLAIFATLTLLSNSAFADREGFYVSAAVGSTKLLEANELLTDNGIQDFTMKSEAKVSPEYLLSAGYYVDDNFRIALSYNCLLANYQTPNKIIKYISVNDREVTLISELKRSSSVQSTILAGYYDINPESKVSIFLGCGVGIAKIKEKVKLTASGTDGLVYVKKSEYSKTSPKLNLAYSLTLGTAIKLTDSTKLDITYSWKDYGKTHPKIDEDGDKPTSNRYRGHHLGVGVRFDI